MLKKTSHMCWRESFRGINEVNCIESLMIAYDSKMDIFEEMRQMYFLKF